jgi:rhamnulokinase
MSAASYVAVDLGAESGRVILGKLADSRLQLQEIYRFPTNGVSLGNHLYWDILRLWSEIKFGLHQAGFQSGDSIQSIGVDTWGVDFGLLDANDNLIGNPCHYRDHRTDGMLEAVFKIISRDEVYAQTGVQFMQLNSIYQLFAMSQTGDPALSIAKTFLNMPDLFNFFLTGVKTSEFTIATTTQCYNPIKRDWASGLLATLGIPPQLFREIVSPGTELGKLRPSIADELDLTAISVIASAGHDTASAVAAVPAVSPDYLYLSSGTWSLMGVELENPIINSESLHANLTNEGGVDGKFRFLKNIVGLWLVQECRRQWKHEGAEYDYAELTQMAASAPAFRSLINPEDQRFLSPENMPAAIQFYCQQTGQTVPFEKGAILRCVLESLALEYRWVAEQIDHLTGKAHPTLHIIGGGTQNKLLNQFAANATGRIVTTGPVEATAIGNILVQALATGEISSLAEGREIVCNSMDIKIYEPQDTANWNNAYARYKNYKSGQ